MISRAFINNSIISSSLKEPSLFNKHLLTTKNIDYKFHYTHYDYLPAIILFISFLLLVWIYVSNFKNFNQVFKGFYSSRKTKQFSKDDISLASRVTVFLTVLFILTLSLFISQVLSYYGLINFSNEPALLYLFAMSIVVATYLLKIIIINIIGFVFQSSKAASEYIVTIFLYCNSMGLFLFPVVICIAFVKQISLSFFIYIVICIIVLLFLIRIFRGFMIWFRGLRVSPFYLFLYLCTLEIVPFFILVKLSALLIK